MLKDLLPFTAFTALRISSLSTINQKSQAGTNWAFPTRDPAAQKLRGLVEFYQNLQEEASKC